MKQYPKYKDSKIPWIGDVPEHWEKRRTKNMFVRMNRPVEPDDEVITCFRDGQVTLRKNRRTDGFTESFKEIGYQGIRPGDLVVHQMDAFAGAIGVSDSKGKGTPVYICLHPQGEYSNFYYAYLLREMARKGYIKSLYRGIRERSSDFRYDTLGKLFLPIPPYSEQQAIVEFLDSAVEKIDRYIAAKEAEIEKLGTLKQSVISQAVTKGLNPNAPMKDSGIPWIGDVPEHWEKRRTKNMFVRMNRPVEPDDEVITCFRDGQVTLRKNRRTDGFTESFKEIGYQGIRPGDLVVHQMDAFAGAIGVSDSKGKGTPVYICLHPQGEYSNFYYAYLLREMARKGYIKSLYRGIRERSSDFRYDTLGKLFLPIPPYSEQQAIVEYIDEQVQKIDTSIINIRQQIEKLKVYKQRLISDAVTGKIDVRERLG